MPIEVFDNSYPDRDYQITIQWPESDDIDSAGKVSLPGLLLIKYIPDRHCLNRESLRSHLEKLAELDFLDQKVLNQLLAALVNSCNPREMEIIYAPESDRSSKTALKRTYKRKDLRVEE